MNREDKLIEVCDKCFRAACWYGEFMCDDADIADTTKLPIKALRKLKAEHPKYWSNKKLIEVYGTANPS